MGAYSRGGSIEERGLNREPTAFFDLHISNHWCMFGIFERNLFGRSR